MPLPIVPPPQTAIDLIFSVGIRAISGLAGFGNLRRSLLQLDGHRDGVAASKTQGGETFFQSTILQSIDQRGENPGAGSADRMPEGYGAAMDVDTVPIPAQFAAVGNSLRS